jgi:hypothetical protein
MESTNNRKRQQQAIWTRCLKPIKKQQGEAMMIGNRDRHYGLATETTNNRKRQQQAIGHAA